MDEPIRASDVQVEAPVVEDTRRRLPLPAHACSECGVINERVLAALEARDEQIERLKEDVGNLEMDLRGKRARITDLRAKQANANEHHPLYAEAMEVLLHWKGEVHPAARELKGKRLENTLARLGGKKADAYTVAELKRSVDGYKLKPYVVPPGKRSHTGTQDQWRADAELIFRDPQHVDAGIRIADHADSLRAALASAPQPAGEDLSDLGLAALRFAGAGWQVFPCKPRDKVPANRNGFLGASADEEKIRATWLKYPDLNIGVRCGTESGLIVLDVDGDEGFDSLRELEKLHGELPLTASVKTPRGGQHFYFAHPGVEIRNTTGFPATHLDVRGDGGYVLAPPSIHPNGLKYEPDDQAALAPMPAWLVTLLTHRQTSADTRIGAGRDWAAFITEGTAKGERNDRMTQYVGHLFSHGHSAGETLELAKLLNLKVKPPLSEREISSVVASIARTEARKKATP